MPSVVRERSYSSVRVFWLDKDLLNRKLRESADRIVGAFPQVREVILFGSILEDRATSRSDIDILIVVDKADRRFIDRPLDFKRYFNNIGMGVDIFVYTEEEIKKGSRIAQEAFNKGHRLFKRPSRKEKK